jgi:hypothetical protein
VKVVVGMQAKNPLLSGGIKVLPGGKIFYKSNLSVSRKLSFRIFDSYPFQ